MLLLCEENVYRKFSPHQLVVFGQTLRPAGGTGLNLRERQTGEERETGDERDR